MIQGRDIVCVSTQDWDGLWTRKQRFMSMFAANGNRVLYVETPVHLLGFDVLPSDPLRSLRFLRGPRPVQPNLHIATLPLLLPFFQMSAGINRLNHKAILALLRHWIRKLGFHRPLLWIYTPFSSRVVSTIDHDIAVYECVDEFRASKGLVRKETIAAMEDDLLRRVDLTIVTQENLLKHRAELCDKAFCVPNGADFEQFSQAARAECPLPPDLARIPRPILGFVGHLQYWIDFKLIRFLAESRPGQSIVLVGPSGPLARTDLVKGLKNVFFLGGKPRDQVPAYIQAMDLCLNPYHTGELAQNCSPLKLYEYLAAGKPVVSTEMPEARKFPESVHVGESYPRILELCDSVLSQLPESPDVILRRLGRASQHSWKSRFAEINRILEDSI